MSSSESPRLKRGRREPARDCWKSIEGAVSPCLVETAELAAMGLSTRSGVGGSFHASPQRPRVLRPSLGRRIGTDSGAYRRRRRRPPSAPRACSSREHGMHGLRLRDRAELANRLTTQMLQLPAKRGRSPLCDLQDIGTTLQTSGACSSSSQQSPAEAADATGAPSLCCFLPGVGGPEPPQPAGPRLTCSGWVQPTLD
jgi:hypothetical protein